MFDALVSPSTLMRREILAVAVSEAVRYGTTVRDVIEAFFGGAVKPEMAAHLDRVYRAAGIPPHEMMELVGRFLDADEIEPYDLVVVISGYVDRLPSGAQAKEIVEAAQRLARRCRGQERRIKVAQAAHDAQIEVTPEQPLLRQQVSLRRPVRARAVQRYRGLEPRR